MHYLSIIILQTAYDREDKHKKILKQKETNLVIILITITCIYPGLYD